MLTKSASNESLLKASSRRVSLLDCWTSDVQLEATRGLPIITLHFARATLAATVELPTLRRFILEALRKVCYFRLNAGFDCGALDMVCGLNSQGCSTSAMLWQVATACSSAHAAKLCRRYHLDRV